ncbi:MAG: phosphoribosylaminoimidazolesuccinocarboxamide synthase [Deltaproteobacteria bacterium]|nr:phosphoribosylaminoimidazolesuccinocarboxamide synthase [Deltaproteobacteria bacterium]MBW2312431.1 phosphoribosylaminoimidazolesuccinocarboxamide synthase [Deltaproteobacteria bacterium]
MTVTVVRETHFPELKLANRGKVRDIYDLGDTLLIVTTDRMSAFDVVMDDPIPDKGKVLNKISLFWFEKTSSIIENHVITANPDEYPEVCWPYREYLEDRSMLVIKAKPLPVECVVRGYISGSGWREYQEKGSISGVALPDGLKESSKLPESIFTPSTKAEVGLHDENISIDEVVRLVGEDVAGAIKRISLEIYEFGMELAAGKGIIIADTKFEFGYKNGSLILIDEVLTPDSSRFWPMDEYEPGRAQRSFDKQFLRDYLDGLDWPKKPPPPKLPEEVINITRDKYLEALQRITGRGL